MCHQYPSRQTPIDMSTSVRDSGLSGLHHEDLSEFERKPRNDSLAANTSIEPIRQIGHPWCDLRHGVFYGLPQRQRETKKRRQKVRTPLPLLAHLRRWRRQGLRYVVEWNGEPVKRITKSHNAVVKACGLGAQITPHIWRHTVATWLIQRGADPWKSAQFLAMSLETLLRVYGHHRPDHSADVHRALGGAMARKAI
jgi:hypothetical protein